MWCVCARVVCGVCACVVCGVAGQGRRERRGEEKKNKPPEMDNTTGYKHDANSLVKYKKHKETLENMSKQKLHSWHDMVNHGPQNRSKNDHFSQSIVFLNFPLDILTFSAESPIPNAQICVFCGVAVCVALCVVLLCVLCCAFAVCVAVSLVGVVACSCVSLCVVLVVVGCRCGCGRGVCVCAVACVVWHAENPHV